ncbi:MAG TPA: ATP-binding cassette domain-containing protein [Nitrososphaeraceae archaeon]|nr:ATP-binding cassette domain-containing protein [Nitrososphaeraceae archaeon]
MITVRNLVKQYDNLTAVDNLSLDIRDNEVFGLLGQNGAGKTTIIHMLATLLKPTSGTASVDGYDIINEPAKVRASIGIVFQAPSSDDMLTGYENLKLHSMLYSLPRKIREKRILDVLELVGLTERKNDQVKKYSGGMRRRLEIARGILHKPKILFLDEPTLGLDPRSRESMWEYIQRLVQEEKITIILTTHYMEEADILCDRIGIIERGKIIALDTPSKLKENVGGGDIIKLRLGDNKQDIDVLLKNLSFIHEIGTDASGSVVLTVEDASRNLPIILKKINVESVEFSNHNLNDVFIHFTAQNFREQPEGGFMEKFAHYDK